ncbi:subtype I-C CRISPR-associated endonuclease Cas1 [Saccharibacillus sp. O16]|nr:subtype I-C CRISPR-associated endonuclease Cas1 [Saccharibacillus sp. O16]
MRKLLNTLYVTMPESYLAKDGENIVVLMGEKEQQKKFQVPAHNLEQIVTFGYAGASPAVFQLCAERGIGLTFLNQYGAFQARLQGKINGNVLLRRKQYRMADGEEAVRIAGRFIQAKIINSRSVLRRAVRDHGAEMDTGIVSAAAHSLKRLSLSVLKMPSGDTIRGAEGEAAKIYFGVMNELVLGDREFFHMQTRSRRPPLDPFNALLSFYYTLLRNDVQSALETVGLDPAVGFLHRDRPGRASLALDLMEELRPYLADRLVLSLINRRQLSEKSFIVKENGAVLLKDEARKEVLMAWQKRKQEEITHPYLGEKIPIGLLPYAQALLLARHIRGDLEDYPPFLWK